MKTIPLVTVEVVVISLIATVSAWNQLCREAIESTAMSAISYMRLRRLKVMLKGQDLVDYTWWADEVLDRIPESRDLHYQLQVDNTCKSFTKLCNDGLCLIDGATYFFSMLMKAGYALTGVKQPDISIPTFVYPREINFSPSDCLKYLVVLISDLHHPLHLDFIGDEALSNYTVNLDGFEELRAISEEKLKTSQPKLADFISSVYMPHYIKKYEDSWFGGWTNVAILGSRYHTEIELFNRHTWSSFEIWATETAAINCNNLILKEEISTDSKGHPVINFSEAISSRLGFILRYQILLAGARVAITINYILTHRDILYDGKTGLTIEKDPELAWTKEDYMAIIGLIILVAFFGGLFGYVYYVLRMVFKEYRANRTTTSAATDDTTLPSSSSSSRYQPVNY